jgi:DNA topoisomerase-2
VRKSEIWSKYKSEGGHTMIVSAMRLQKGISLSNMTLFNEHLQIKRYTSPLEIIEEFYPIRLSIYHKRKEYMLSVIRAELKILTQKFKFIKGVSSGTIDFRGMNKT